MKKILVTSGAVYAHLDDVKLITNRFKGGLMAQFAKQLAEAGNEVIYLSSRDAAKPDHGLATCVEHDGFDDYRKKVLDLALEMDGVVLGAAVANLIPKNPIKGKFPSHNYKPGDTIPIDFTIAPRVINEVRRVAPRTSLFGFKLLSGVPHEELIHAAYTVVLESGATAVFANDAKDLSQIYAVTKERGVRPMPRADLSQFIMPFLSDQYYRTKVYCGRSAIPDIADVLLLNNLIKKYEQEFVSVEEGYRFGTVAVRLEATAFLTTSRGKKELDGEPVVVNMVDHNDRVVYVRGGGDKATLNAPLLSYIFERLPEVVSIVHYHRQISNLYTCPYAPPGTVRDSIRPQTLMLIPGHWSEKHSFNIENHGCFLLFNKEGKMI